MPPPGLSRVREARAGYLVSSRASCRRPAKSGLACLPVTLQESRLHAPSCPRPGVWIGVFSSRQSNPVYRGTADRLLAAYVGNNRKTPVAEYIASSESTHRNCHSRSLLEKATACTAAPGRRPGAAGVDGANLSCYSDQLQSRMSSSRR